MTNLPFWSDDLDLFFYLPENRMLTFEEAVQKEGITSTMILQCKAWWNTNIPMDKFLPVLIPVDTKDDSDSTNLLNFIERVKQRAEGIMYPTPPELHVKIGIVILDKINGNVVGVMINTPNHENEISILANAIDVLSKPYIQGEVIPRNNECLYWDMLEHKYV